MRKTRVTSHNPRVEVRPSTLEDYRVFYNIDSLPFTTRGLSFFLDGELVGLAGVRFFKTFFLVFSEIRPDVNVSRATIYRCGIEVMNMVDDLNIPVVAVPGNGLTAPNFLKHLGFTPDETGEVYYYG